MGKIEGKMYGRIDEFKDGLICGRLEGWMMKLDRKNDWGMEEMIACMEKSQKLPSSCEQVI